MCSTARVFAAHLALTLSACSMFSAGSKAPAAPAARAADAQLVGLAIKVPQPVLRGPDAHHANEISADLRRHTGEALRKAGFRVLVDDASTADPSGATAALTLVVDYCYVDVVRLETRLAVLRDGEPVGELVVPASEMPRRRFAEQTSVEISNYLSGLTALAGGASTAEPAQASQPETAHVVAVLDIQDSARSVDATILSQLTDYLTAQVIQKLGWKALPRSAIREQLRAEKAASYSACVDDACQIELGKALAAEKILTTKLLELGRECTLVASLYDLRTEAAESAATTKTGCTPKDLADGVNQLLEELMKSQRKGSTKR